MNAKSAHTESLPIAWREYCKTYGSLDAKRIEGVGLGLGIAFAAVWVFFSLFFGTYVREITLAVLAVTVAECILARFLRSRIGAGAVGIIGIIAFALSFEVYARVNSTEPWIKDGIYLGVIIVSAVMLICAGAAFLTAYCVMRKDYAEFNEQ